MCVTGQVVTVLERYKTLGAALALGEFSVPELSTLSGVREVTVRTILRRESQYLEKTGVQRTGRRGGQHMRWRLRPGAREHLRDLLRQLEQLGAGPWLSEHQEEDQTPLAGLIAAEDVLLRLAPAESNQVGRAELIKLARAHLDAAKAMGSAIAGSPAQGANRSADSHRGVVELLLELEAAEQTALRTERSELTHHGQELIARLRQAAAELDDQLLANAILNRLHQSPLEQSDSTESLVSVAPGDLLHGPDPRLLSEISRLRERIYELEAELVRLQEENEALMVEADHEDLLIPDREPEPRLT